MTKFRKGQSGNPIGKPKGAKDKRTELRSLLQPHAEELVNKAVRLALDGDVAALRLCIDRLIPPIKAKDSPIDIGNLQGSLSDQGRRVLSALSAGGITPDEANSLMHIIASQARIIEVSELEGRIATLEGQKAQDSASS
ncbi:MAG: DUF5681 domain-containing protein [Betaproteobacteria bacterium]